MGDIHYELFKFMNEHGRKEQATVSGWISVKDRLPEDSVKVLCRIAMLCDYPDLYDVEDYFICEGHFDANPSSRIGGWYINYRPDVSRKVDKVTHWMPLPEPPEEVDG